MTQDERFELLHSPHIGRYQLLNLLNDSYETNNLLLPRRREIVEGRGNILNPGYIPPLREKKVDAIVAQLNATL